MFNNGLHKGEGTPTGKAACVEADKGLLHRFAET
jgi:hypothetical protein